jgi:hypothetical protein
MTPTLGRKKQSHAEDQMQAAIIQHIELRKMPGLLYWHTPNSSKMGGKRTAQGVPLAAIRLKKLGLLPGVSDLLFLFEGHFYALELKSKSQQPTETQYAYIYAVNAAGGTAFWTDNLDIALLVLETWGLIRPNAMLKTRVG